MKKRLLSIFQLLLFLGLGIFLVVWIYRGLTPEQVQKCKTAFANAHWSYVSLLIVFGFSALYFRSLRWKLLMKPMGLTPRTGNTLAAVTIGYLANLAFPRLGEVLKCGILNRYEKLPVDKLVGTIIVERLFDTVCLLILLAGTVLTQLGLLQDFFVHNLQMPIQEKFGHIAWWIPLAFLLCCGMAAFIAIKWLMKHQDSKIGKFVFGLGDGIRSIAQMENKFLFLLYTVGIWGSYATVQYIAFYTLNETSNLPIGAAFSCMTFGSFGVIATQGGLGAYHFIIQSILSLYGLAKEYGFAYAWISWGVQNLVFVIGGLFALLYLPFANKDKKAAI